MRLDFDIYEFIRRMLPLHKRQTNRLALFDWGLSQLRVVWYQFTAWRTEMIYESNITGQKMALEHFLNYKVPGSQDKIFIVEKLDGGLFLSLVSENSEAVFLSTEAEDSDFSEIPLNGEQLQALDVNFQVFIPAYADLDILNQILQRYVIAGMNYEVLYSSNFSNDFNNDFNI